MKQNILNIIDYTRVQMEEQTIYNTIVRAVVECKLQFSNSDYRLNYSIDYTLQYRVDYIVKSIYDIIKYRIVKTIDLMTMQTIN